MKNILTILVFSLTLSVAWGQKKYTPPRDHNEKLNEAYCTGLFTISNAEYFDMVNDKNNFSAISYLNILDWLQGRVAGLTVYKARNNVRIPYIRNQRAGIYVNEVWVEYDFLNTLPAMDIAMIKIIKGPFLGRWGGAGGAIAIYTKKGDEE